MILRKLENIITQNLFRKKVIVILGARQTGKTTLLKKIMAQTDNCIWINGDEYDIQERF
jgi:predicted AAA+ superfamily ATPase